MAVRRGRTRNYLDRYTDEDLENAKSFYYAGGTSYRKAGIAYGVPPATLARKVTGKQTKKHGGQPGLSVAVETEITNVINCLTDWRVPLTGLDVRGIVKNYLDMKAVVHRVFRDNMPGKDWLRGFMKRNDLTARFPDRVKPVRFEISPEEVNNFFQHYEATIADVPVDNIYNFDETNLTDDPSRKKCIVRRGLCRVEKKVASSKQAFSVMFCGNAAGKFLPPMVVYKSGHVYTRWVEGGPAGTIYYSTESGWFDTTAFELWFFDVFLEQTKDVVGPRVIVADNLGCHFSTKVINACQELNIRFCTLIPNATHLMQPLDVAVFRPAKTIWRTILSIWRNESRSAGCIPKSIFPQLLAKLCKNLNGDNLVSGFHATGLSQPADRQKILQKLSGGPTSATSTVDVSALSDACIEFLRQHCAPTEKPPRTPRGKKVTYGKAISLKDETCDVSWVCKNCDEAWKVDDNRWIVCDICDQAYHLQCSGITYKKRCYYELDIASMAWACHTCS